MVFFALTMCHHITVDNNSATYSLTMCEHFDSINYHELYEFVITNPHIVNKVKVLNEKNNNHFGW